MSVDSVTTDIEVTCSFHEQDETLTRAIRFGKSEYHSSIAPVDPTDDSLGDWWRSYLSGVRPRTKQNQRQIRVAELFSGPGGLAQGVKQACRELGYEFHSVFAADHDSDALGVYHLNHGTKHTTSTSVSSLVDYRITGHAEDAAWSTRHEPCLTDTRLSELAGNVDLLLAGPPCQGHSNLNNHTRRDDARNELYLAVPAIAITARIPMIIIENVTAIVHDQRSVVSTAYELLRQAGYQIETGVLKADQLGWPQTRARFFMVARLDATPIPLNVISSALTSEPRDVLWAIGDLASVEEDDGMNRRPQMSDENIDRVKWLFSKKKYELALHMRPDCHRDGTTYTAVYGRMYPNKPAPTLTTGFMTPGRGRFVHPTQRRVLTPREAARIQGFPDTYRWKTSGDPEPKSHLLAKWIGDAVPMPLGHAAALSALGPGLIA